MLPVLLISVLGVDSSVVVKIVPMIRNNRDFFVIKKPICKGNSIRISCGISTQFWPVKRNSWKEKTIEMHMKSTCFITKQLVS
jgi:hypothetical protein